MYNPDRAAAHILESRRARRVTGDLPGGPSNIAEAVQVQAALARRVGAWPPAGFKIGATAVALQRYLGLDRPVAGFMAEGGLHGNNSTLSHDGFINPGVECELAVVLYRPLPGPCTPDQAADAVGQLMPAIELVENRGAANAVALVADGAFHAGAVLGQPFTDWRGMDLRALPGRLTVNGADCGAGVGADLLGGPMEALAWLAGSAEARAFGGLQAGQVVLLGSVCPPVWLDGPARVVATFGGASVAVELV